MFDPNLPQAGTEINAVQMRGQLKGLKDLIDAISNITYAQVDSTTTLNPAIRQRGSERYRQCAAHHLWHPAWRYERGQRDWTARTTG